VSADLYVRALPDWRLIAELDQWLLGPMSGEPILDAAHVTQDLDEHERLMSEYHDYVEQWEQQRDQLEATLSPWAHDRVWVGQVSWLKASIYEDGQERFIPRTVELITGMLSLPRLLTPELRGALCCAYSTINHSIYGRPTKRHPHRNGMRGLGRARDMKRFCERHMGKWVYALSE